MGDSHVDDLPVGKLNVDDLPDDFPVGAGNFWPQKEQLVS